MLLCLKLFVHVRMHQDQTGHLEGSEIDTAVQQRKLMQARDTRVVISGPLVFSPFGYQLLTVSTAVSASIAIIQLVRSPPHGLVDTRTTGLDLKMIVNIE